MKQENFLKFTRGLKFIFVSGLLLSTLSQAAQGQFAKLFEAPSHIFDTGRFSEGGNPNSMAIGDLDGDGDKDSVLGLTLSPAGIAVMLNKGNKNFEKTAHYPFGTGNTWHAPQDVQLADFDGDGDLDAIATVTNLAASKVYVWRNNGNATFAAPTTFNTNDYATKLVIADFNGDGFADAAIANENFNNTSGFTVHTHNGQSGNGASFNAPIMTVTNSAANDLVAADFNSDGKPDIAVAANDIRVFINTGKGAFGSSVDYNPAPPATPPNTVRHKGSTVAARDMDNDGDIDLIGSGHYDQNSGASFGTFSILRNNGNGTFAAAEVYFLTMFTYMIKDIEAADINGDGFADVVGTNPSGRTPEGWALMLSNGQGGFQTPQFFNTGQWTYAIETTDADGDGDTDVLTASRDSNALAFFENPGNGAFPVLTHYQLRTFNDATVSADIDNDGDIDIVTNNETDVMSNQGIVVVRKNNGNGTFAASVEYPQPRDYFDLKLRDLNGDGFVDMVFGPDGDSPSYHLGFAMNRGDGRFFPTVVLNMFSCGEGTVDAFDLDNDGDRDIVFTEEQACIGGQPRRIFIYRNDGNGTFVNNRQIAFHGGPQDLGGADLDGDGKIDLLTIHANGLAFLKNLGDFNFAEPVISPVSPGSTLYLFELADLNRDGKLDAGTIINQNYYYARIGTMMGNGDGTFGTLFERTGATTSESLRSAADIDIGDVNGDLYPDLNITNYASNDISVFLTNPDGTLRPQQRYGIGNTPHYSTVADFNGDGKTDFAGVVRKNLIYQDFLVVLRNIAPSARRPQFDFDGDGKSDVSVFRPDSGIWHLLQSQNGYTAMHFGLSNDKLVPADYDGDGKTDIAVFRDGTWYIYRSSDSQVSIFQFGLTGDVPQSGDFDGDGKADLAVFRPSDRIWYLQQSQNGFFATQFGLSDDKPVASDYDGDGKTDIAVFRPSDRVWYLLRSRDGFTSFQWGISTDKPVPADYDGDGKADIAVYRDGVWYLSRSRDGILIYNFGLSQDKPAAADYDGDGKADLSVYREGVWHLQQSTNGYTSLQFGLTGDVPVPFARLP